jgi:hypothetical protein
MSLTDVRDGYLHLRQRKTGKPLRLAVEGELAGVLERIKGRQVPRKGRCDLRPGAGRTGQPLTYDALFGPI